MKNYSITTKRLRYIVPFEYNPIEDNREKRSFEEICQLVDNYEEYTSLQYGKYFFEEIEIQRAPKKDIDIQNGETSKPQFRKRRRSCKWERMSLKEGEQDVYDYIVDEFSGISGLNDENNSEKSGCFWRYSVKGQSSFKMDFRFTSDKKFKYSEDKKQEIENLTTLSITQIGLYIFRSGIGLLYYEIEDPSNSFETSDDLIQFQNIIKELNQNQSAHCWIQRGRVSGVEIEECWIPFMLGNWVAERLKFLDVSYQANRNNAYKSMLGSILYPELNKKKRKEILKDYLPELCPDKAILFSYLVFDRGENWKVDEEEMHISYYLTNGYDKKYEPSSRIGESIQTPFSNVIWMASKEGCGYFAWVEDSSNRSFFESNMTKKIMYDYFLLYIRVLYQSFSLMYYSKFLSSKELPNYTEHYFRISDKTESLSDTISEISTEVSLFLVKSLATSVSHIQHQSDYYVYLCEQLKIQEDVKSVTTGLSALHDLQRETLLKKEKVDDENRKHEQKIEAKADKISESKIQLTVGSVALLAVISAISDGYAMFASIYDHYYNGSLPGRWFIAFEVLKIGCLVIAVIAAFVLIRGFVNWYKANKALKLLKEQSISSPDEENDPSDL